MMRCRVLYTSVLVVAVAMATDATAGDKIKNRNWQTGKLLDSERNRYLAGTTGSATTPTLPGSEALPKTTYGSQRAVYREYQTYTIQGDRYVYVAQERLGQAANLTVNGPVKYAVEKLTLFVVDEDGKEHEMEVIKKILREDAPKQ